jgi:hypothetical protein
MTSRDELERCLVWESCSGKSDEGCDDANMPPIANKISFQACEALLAFDFSPSNDAEVRCNRSRNLTAGTAGLIRNP